MKTLLGLLCYVVVAAPGGLLGLLLFVAVTVIVLWAIWELLKWAGVPIPRPVQIVLIAVVSIVLIVFIFRALGYAI